MLRETDLFIENDRSLLELFAHKKIHRNHINTSDFIRQGAFSVQLGDGLLYCTKMQCKCTDSISTEDYIHGYTTK